MFDEFSLLFMQRNNDFFFSRFFAVGVVKGSLQVDWMDARGEENMVWQNMMERPNTWVDAKLPLRASMGKVSAKK